MKDVGTGVATKNQIMVSVQNVRELVPSTGCPVSVVHD